MAAQTSSPTLSSRSRDSRPCQPKTGCKHMFPSFSANRILASGWPVWHSRRSTAKTFCGSGNSPATYGHTHCHVLRAGVFTGSGTDRFDLGRTTLFDVDKRRTVKQPNVEIAYFQYRLTLHEGAEDLLNSALGTSYFTPGMRIGTLLLDVDAGS